MSGEKIAESLALSIDLRGYIGPDTQGKPPGFRLEDFEVDTEKQQAICPAGQASQRWVPATGNTDNRVAVYIFFGKQCLDYPFFGPDRCTASQTGRKLSLNAFHNVIQARQREERTECFHLEMYARAVIEAPSLNLFAHMVYDAPVIEVLKRFAFKCSSRLQPPI